VHARSVPVPSPGTSPRSALGTPLGAGDPFPGRHQAGISPPQVRGSTSAMVWEKVHR
jgi:hypothetical protein